MAEILLLGLVVKLTSHEILWMAWHKVFIDIVYDER